MKGLYKTISMFLIWILCVSVLPVSAMALELPELSVIQNVVEAVETETLEETQNSEEAETDTVFVESEQLGNVYPGDGLTWTLSDDGVLTISGEGAMTDYFIEDPPWHDVRWSIKSVVIEEGVTSVGSRAFLECVYLKSVTLPEGLTHIDVEAFKDCGFEVISLPDSVISIGAGAFGLCDNLKSITIPDGVTSIRERMFENCYKLTSVVLPDGLTSIGKGAFSGCKSLKTISIPDSVTNIGESVFSGCESLLIAVMGKGITSIDKDLFYNCDGLLSIIIPDGVINIENCAFYGCDSLVHVNYTGTADKWNAIAIGDYNTSLTSALRCYSDEPCDMALIDSCSVLKYRCSSCGECIYEPKSEQTHEYYDGTCCVCGASEQLVYSVVNGGKISDGKVVIVDYTGNEDNVVVPSVIDGFPVTGIGRNAFQDCSDLISITIPKSVTSISERAFHRCGSLAHVNYTGAEKEWYRIVIKGDNGPLTTASRCYSDSPSEMIPFETCTATGKRCSVCGERIYMQKNELSHDFNNGICLVCGASDKFLYSVGEYGEITITDYTGNDTELVIPSVIEGLPVTCIGENAFNKCSSLTCVTLPDSVTSIESFAFSGCEGLVIAEIGDRVTSIGEGAFSGCSSLESFVFPDSVTSINRSMFSACSSLTSVTIPDGVISIGQMAFYNCTSLKEITIPTSVIGIASYAFKNCRSLQSITIPDGVTSVDYWAFDDCISLKALTMHNGVTMVALGAFRNCSALEHILFIGTEDEWGAMSVGDENESFDTEPCYGEEGDAITFSEEGSGSYLYCSACGKKFAVKTHTFSDWYVSKVATCSETGERRRDCTDCEYYETEVIVTVAHTWDTGMITREPALNVDGVKTYTCSGCGGTKAESIPAIHYDVTNNGFTDARDVVALMKHIIGAEVAKNADALDVNGDGKVDILDVVCLVRLLA